MLPRRVPRGIVSRCQFLWTSTSSRRTGSPRNGRVRCASGTGVESAHGEQADPEDGQRHGLWHRISENCLSMIDTALGTPLIAGPIERSSVTRRVVTPGEMATVWGDKSAAKSDGMLVPGKD